MWIIGPTLILAVSAGAWRVLAKAAYKKGLNEYTFGLLGLFATLMAGLLSSTCGAALDPANADISGTIFGGLFFLPMEALYVSAIFYVIKLCPADAGELAHAISQQRAAQRGGWQEGGDQ